MYESLGLPKEKKAPSIGLIIFGLGSKRVRSLPAPIDIPSYPMIDEFGLRPIQ